MSSIALEKLFNLHEIILLSQFDGLVPLIKQYTAIDSTLDIAKLYESSNCSSTKTHGLEALTQVLKNRRILRNNFYKFLHVGEVFKLVVGMSKGFVIVRKFEVFSGFSPLLSLSRIVTKVFVSFLEHLIVTSSTFHKSDYFRPVTKSHSEIKSEIFSVNVLEDLFSFVIALKEYSHFSLLFDLLIKVVKSVNKLDSIVILILYEGTFGNLEVKFV